MTDNQLIKILVTWPIIPTRWGLGCHTEAVGVIPLRKKARHQIMIGPTRTFLQRCEMHQLALADQMNRPEEAVLRHAKSEAVLRDAEHK